MFSYLESNFLQYILKCYCHVEVFGTDNWREDLISCLTATEFPQREKEFRHQLAYAILNQTISPSEYEKLTDLELETNEEVVQELQLLWVYLYGDEPVSLGSL